MNRISSIEAGGAYFAVYRPRATRLNALFEERVIERFLKCCDPHHGSTKEVGVAKGAPGDERALAARASSAWARLIHKVYEVDPLECPKCKGPMHVIALIDDAEVIERILKHLGIWAPRRNAPQEARPPPSSETGGETTHAANVLTYHPVPDIA